MTLPKTNNLSCVSDRIQRQGCLYPNSRIVSQPYESTPGGVRCGEITIWWRSKVSWRDNDQKQLRLSITNAC